MCKFKLLAACFCLSILHAQTTLTVSEPGDNNVNAGGTFNSATLSGDLRGCLNYINMNSGTYDITVSLPSIDLNGILPLLNLNASNNITIFGNGVIINGGGDYPGLYARQGTVFLENITFQDCIAQGGTGGYGGSGGGGGMGAGGSLFIDSAAVTVSGVQFNQSTAAGGTGGIVSIGGSTTGIGGGGGGGMYGGTGGNTPGVASSGDPSGGCGGGGLGGDGGFAPEAEGASGGGGIGPGGNGGSGGSGNSGGGYGAGPGGKGATGSGGSNAGGGGASNDQLTEAVGLGAGGGGANGNNRNGRSGGNGGYGGGGGGSGSASSGSFTGGAGGFGGGGGGMGVTAENDDQGTGTGGIGGFGGGGGAAGWNANGTTAAGSTSLFGGGGGGSTRSSNVPGGVGGGYGGGASNGANGGGGAGFGGAIFVNTGSLTIQGGCSTSTNSVSPGSAGGGGSGAGYSAGTDLFAISSTGGLGFNPIHSSDIITFTGTIADDSVNSVPTGGSWTAGSGSGTVLNLLGSGTLQLAAGSTYSGGTNLSSGTLSISNSSALGSGTITLGGTLLLNFSGALTQPLSINGGALNVASNSITIGSVITGSNGFTLQGTTGSLTLSNTGNVYSGTTTVSGGTLIAGNNGVFSQNSSIQINSPGVLNLNNKNNTIPGLTGNGSVSLGTATLTFAPSTLYNYSGVISGMGGIVINGSGIQEFSNVNNYMGSTVIQSGTLRMGVNDALPAGSPLTLMGTGAILDLNNLNCSFSGVTGSSGSLITLGTGTLTISATSTYSGTITGTTGGVTVTGGTFTLGGNGSAYSGTTDITGGTLEAATEYVLSPSSLVTVGAAGTLDMSGYAQTIPGLSGSGTVTLGNATLTVLSTSGASSNFAGAITGAGGVSLSGNVAFTLSGSGLNSFEGFTYISPNTTLLAGAVNALSSASTVLMAGGTLNLQGYNVTIPTLFSIAVTGTPQILLGSGTLTLNGSVSSGFGGAISGTGGGLTIGGTQIFQLSGSGLNTYSGTTTINGLLPAGGTLQAGADYAFSPYSPIVINNNGILDLNNYPQSIPSLTSTSTASLVRLGSGTLTLTGTGSSYAGDITGSGGLTINGGTHTLSGSSSYLGTTLILGLFPNPGSLQAGGPLVFSSSSAIQIEGAGSLVLNGHSQEIASLSSSSSAAQVNLGSGFLLLMGSTSTTYAGSISGSGGLSIVGNMTFNLSGANLNDYTGQTTVYGTLQAGAEGAFSPYTEVILQLGGVLDLHNYNQTIATIVSASPSSAVTLGNGYLTLTGNTSTTFAGSITGFFGGLNIQLNPGTIFTLSNANNSFSGDTVISSGTLQAGNVNTFSSLSPIEIEGDGILDLHGFSQTIPSLSSSSTTASVTLGTGTLTLSGNANTTFAGSISGNGGVNKSGGGEFILTGANTYTGPTFVSSTGRLVVDGSITSNVQVYNGGSFGGSGTITGNVTIYNGGQYKLGDPVTQMISGTYTQTSGATLVIDVTPTSADEIQVSGTPGIANLNGTLEVVAERGDYGPLNSFPILTATGGIYGQFGTVIFSALLTNPSISYTSNEVSIIYGFGLPVLSCITGNALALVNYLNANLFTNPTAQNIAFDLLPDLTNCSAYLADLETISPARYATRSAAALDLGLANVRAFNNRILINHLPQVGGKQREETAMVFFSPDRLFAANETGDFSLPLPPAEMTEDLPLAAADETGGEALLPHGNVKRAARGNMDWDLWIEGFDEYMHEGKQNQVPAFGANLGGLLLGSERFFQNGVVGFGGGYARGLVNERHNLGTGKLDDYTGFAYGSVYRDNGYCDIGAFVSYLHIDAMRNIFTPGTTATTESSHHAWQGIAHVSGGYDFILDWATIEPFAAVDWIIQSENKIVETGPSYYNMEIFPRSYSVLQSEIGGRFYESWSGDWGLCILKESVSYVNAIPFGVGRIKAALVDVGGRFSQKSFTSVGNFFHGGLQIFVKKESVYHKAEPFISVSYDFEIGPKFVSNSGQGMIGVYF